MKKSEEKTNVMRVLDAKKIKYTTHYYGDTDAISGAEIVSVLNEDPRYVFKTLVTEGASKKNYVFLVPVLEELDLKKAARTVGEKSIAMIKSKELLPLTGYIHGGCSPIGMKKEFPTVIDATASQYEKIMFSAGKIGYQIETDLEELARVLRYTLADITV